MTNEEIETIRDRAVQGITTRDTADAYAASRTVMHLCDAVIEARLQLESGINEFKHLMSSVAEWDGVTERRHNNKLESKRAA